MKPHRVVVNMDKLRVSMEPVGDIIETELCYCDTPESHLKNEETE